MNNPLFLKRTAFFLLTAAICLIFYSRFSNLDLAIEDYYYDAQHQVFPWVNTWFAKKLMHGYVKNTVVMLGRIMILVVLLDLIYPWKIISQWLRPRLRFVAASAFLIPTLVAVLKSQSSLHCPAAIARYHGDAPYLRLFDALPDGVKAGHCFPAGHATVTLWLAAFCVFWLPHAPKTAFKVFSAGLGAGFLLGWVQQMRGMHFLSHTLWSAWLASAIILVLLYFFPQFHPAKQTYGKQLYAI